MRVRVKNALISVSNKESLVLILKTLKKFNINIISSGGTYTYIKKLGYKCTELSKYTGFNEMLDGRVKTLHPKIHAGILHDRQNKKHKNEMSKQNFPSIDLIVVNFYPFQKIVLNTKDSIGIEKGILKLANDKEFRKRISKNGFETIKKEDWRSRVDLFENLLLNTGN